MFFSSTRRPKDTKKKTTTPQLSCRVTPLLGCGHPPDYREFTATGNSGTDEDGLCIRRYCTRSRLKYIYIYIYAVQQLLVRIIYMECVPPNQASNWAPLVAQEIAYNAYLVVSAERTVTARVEDLQESGGHPESPCYSNIDSMRASGRQTSTCLH